MGVRFLKTNTPERDEKKQIRQQYHLLLHGVFDGCGCNKIYYSAIGILRKDQIYTIEREI